MSAELSTFHAALSTFRAAPCVFCCATTACSRPFRRARPGRVGTRAADPTGPLPLFEPSEAPLEPPPSARHPWPWLPRRVFAVDVTVCPRCEGAMRIVEIATRTRDIERVRAELGLGARGSPSPRRALRGQLSLELD